MAAPLCGLAHRADAARDHVPSRRPGRASWRSGAARRPGWLPDQETGGPLDADDCALAGPSAVEALMGLEPSMVVARFHRRYIDANRPERVRVRCPRGAAPLSRDHNRITGGHPFRP